jgi:hypothetical protein
MWETKEDMEICRRGNRQKRKDLEADEEVGKRQNKMEKLHISPMLRKEQQEMMDVATHTTVEQSQAQVTLKVI